MVGGWDGVAEAYAASSAQLCAGTVPTLLESAGAARGVRLLDVGSGTGALSMAAARVGAVVTAVEPDPQMRAHTERTVAGSGVTVLAGALPHLPVTPGYDVTVANFVVNHVPDPRGAVAELARVTRPGGRVQATIWPSGRTVQARLFTDVLDAAGGSPVPLLLSPDEDFARTEEGLAGVFEGAGLAAVTTRLVSWDWRIAPAAFWAGIRAGIGGVGRTYTSQSAAVRARMDAAYDDLRGPLMDGGELVLPSTAVLAVGVA